MWEPIQLGPEDVRRCISLFSGQILPANCCVWRLCYKNGPSVSSGRLSDPALRERSHAGLNKGEASNSLRRAIFFHRQGEIRDRTFENQSFRALGLSLLTAAIVHWNNSCTSTGPSNTFEPRASMCPTICSPTSHRLAGSISRSPAITSGPAPIRWPPSDRYGTFALCSRPAPPSVQFGGVSPNRRKFRQPSMSSVRQSSSGW